MDDTIGIEGYMQAPGQSGGRGGKSGGISIIAGILRALGITKPVEKMPKGESPQTQSAGSSLMAPSQGETQTPTTALQLPALDSAESAFTPLTPIPTDWGKKYLKSMTPLRETQIP